jgi:hypothetical protein
MFCLHIWTEGVSYGSLCVKYTVFLNLRFRISYHGNSVFLAFGQKYLAK